MDSKSVKVSNLLNTVNISLKRSLCLERFSSEQSKKPNYSIITVHNMIKNETFSIITITMIYYSTYCIDVHSTDVI